LLGRLAPSNHNPATGLKNLLTEIRPAIVSTIIFAIVCCGLYPLAFTGIAQLAFADTANGSLILDKNGTLIGSSRTTNELAAAQAVPRKSIASPKPAA